MLLKNNCPAFYRLQKHWTLKVLRCVLFVALKFLKLVSVVGLAYKENDDSSRARPGQSTRQPAKRTNEVLSSPSPTAGSTAHTAMRQDDSVHSQQSQAQVPRPRPPPPKKSHVVPTEPHRSNQNCEQDVHFISVEPKMESEPEIEHIEDRLGNGTDYSARVLTLLIITQSATSNLFHVPG